MYFVGASVAARRAVRCGEQSVTQCQTVGRRSVCFFGGDYEKAVGKNRTIYNEKDFLLSGGKAETVIFCVLCIGGKN